MHYIREFNGLKLRKDISEVGKWNDGVFEFISQQTVQRKTVL
jgi:hypothetical protein